MSKLENRVRLINRLRDLGFSFEEANQLRRIEMTLHRWAELECGDGNDSCSWSIERDEATGKPYMVRHPHTGKSYRTPIADREKGTLKRLDAILNARNERYKALGGDGSNKLVCYQQTDPRGCALYILKQTDIGDSAIDSVYNRGVAVCD